MLTPLPGTVDFAAWEKSLGNNAPRIGGIPVTRHWLIPQAQRPGVRASSRDVPGRDSREDTGRLGPLLQSATHLGAITSDADHSGSNRVRLALEVVPADVHKHRDCH